MHQPMTGKEGGGVLRFNLGSTVTNLVGSTYFRHILRFIKIIAGLVLLILSVRGVQWENLVTGIRSANLSWLALAIFSVLLGLFLKLWRFAILVRNYQVKTSFSRLFSSYFVGQAVNIILPFRSGELVRIGYFAGDPKTVPEIALSIALEKYFDLIALTVCGILVSLKISLDNILNLRGWLLPLTIFLTIFLLLFFLFGPTAWRKIRGGRFPKRFGEWMDRWVEASQWLKNPTQVLPGILLTALIWVVMWLTNLLLFNSLGISVGGTAAGLVLISVYIGLLPALMPGNVGPFYFFASLALVPFGVLHDRAFIFAIVLHAIVTLPPLLGGGIGLALKMEQVSPA